jgi:ADP-heptose:LPS heptosyltransferase
MIHPGASRPNKRWPAERWASVVNRLHGAEDCRIDRFVLSGSQAERELCAAIAWQSSAPAENLAGQLELPALASLQREAALFLSGDTGPYHLAVAVGCPTVTLFAAADRGSSIEACGPHLADPARHRAIATPAIGDPITAIPVEPVAAAAREILASC